MEGHIVEQQQHIKSSRLAPNIQLWRSEGWVYLPGTQTNFTSQLGHVQFAKMWSDNSLLPVRGNAIKLPIGNKGGPSLSSRGSLSTRCQHAAIPRALSAQLWAQIAVLPAHTTTPASPNKPGLIRLSREGSAAGRAGGNHSSKDGNKCGRATCCQLWAQGLEGKH